MSTLTIVDETEQRSDLASRMEMKFVLPSRDLRMVRRIVGQNCLPVQYGTGISTVRSIYFDNATLSACNANIAGDSQRQKLRFRWYDSPRPHRDFFVEIKWRRGLLTGKHRLRAHSEADLSQLAVHDIRDEVGQQLPADYQGIFLRYPDSVVLVQYRREHFVSRDGQSRVTLDYDLVFYRQNPRQRVSARFGHRWSDYFVLEVKTRPDMASVRKSLLFPLHPRWSRCSKYVTACQSCGLV
ncbi:MAG: VTC domain-containing protein [Pirellulaceae bacterium]|nr:VTC domain-containing protein [Planctomycetales bacterium]